MKIERVVVDTNVLVSGLRSKAGASFRLLRLLGKKKFVPTVSTTLVIEYEKALRDRKTGIHFSAREISDFLDYICTVSKLQKVYFLWRPFLKDTKDDMVLELAVAGRCSHIVTFNTKDFVGVEKFGITVVTPQQFLDLIGGKK